MYQRVVLGHVKNAKNKALTDLNFREKFILVPLVVLIVWMGVYSQSFLRKMDASVSQLLDHFHSTAVVLKIDTPIRYNKYRLSDHE